MLGQFNKSAFADLFMKSDSVFAKYDSITHYDFIIAGEKIRLIFGNDRFVHEIIRPIMHLLTSTTSDPDFTLYMIEDETVPIYLYKSDIIPRSGEIRYLCGEQGHVCTYWNQNSQAYALQVLDFEKNTGFFWKNSKFATSKWDLLSPLRKFFHNYFIKKNKLMLHAGAIGFQDRGLLLVGKGGSGKSNTVLSCIESELSLVSDDYLILEQQDGVVAHSLYSNAKFRIEDLHRLPFLKDYYDKEVSSSSFKAVVFLNEVAPRKLIKSTKIKAILAPKISDKTLIESIPKHQVLNAVLPSTIIQIPQNIEKTIAITKEAVDCLPSYQLLLGANYHEVGEVMLNFLSSI